jgi:hypothetical protein
VKLFLGGSVDGKVVLDSTDDGGSCFRVVKPFEEAVSVVVSGDDSRAIVGGSLVNNSKQIRLHSCSQAFFTKVVKSKYGTVDEPVNDLSVGAVLKALFNLLLQFPHREELAGLGVVVVPTTIVHKPSRAGLACASHSVQQVGLGRVVLLDRILHLGCKPSLDGVVEGRRSRGMHRTELPVIFFKNLVVVKRPLVVFLGLEAVEAYGDERLELLALSIPDRDCIRLTVYAFRSHWRGLGW